MLQAAASKDEIMSFGKHAAQDWSDAMACEPCLSLAKELREWLDKAGTRDKESQTSAPITPRAIEDARY